jgi:predicted nucleic acid-binding protein
VVRAAPQPGADWSGRRDNGRVRVYFDICCLKRPFDDQSQPRVRLESGAILALLGEHFEGLELVRAAAQDLENSLNPVTSRANRVQEWLNGCPMQDLDDDVLERRTAELMELGLSGFDALHVASAEAARADVLVTCDDRLLALARRHGGRLRVRVADPLGLFNEVMS